MMVFVSAIDRLEGRFNLSGHKTQVTDHIVDDMITFIAKRRGFDFQGQVPVPLMISDGQQRSRIPSDL